MKYGPMFFRIGLISGIVNILMSLFFWRLDANLGWLVSTLGWLVVLCLFPYELLSKPKEKSK